MAKFNTPSVKAAGPKSPMTTTGPTTTHEGGAAFIRDAKSELYLLAVTNLVGEDTFYERARQRDDRFVQLVRSIAVSDPAWLYRFLGWLRNGANMRSASVVVAAEAIRARLDSPEAGEQFYLSSMPKGWFGSKDFIPQAMARADEPGEFLAYWTGTYGMALPKPVKRGLALAVQKLFDEYAYAKYGQADGGFGLGRLVDLVHVKPKDTRQGDLFEHALDKLHKRDKEIPESLVMLHNRARFMAIPQDNRAGILRMAGIHHDLKDAGITWEALSGWLGGELDATFWEGLIPTMGYMALLRNLRNFEKAQISKSARKAVQERLSDPEQVARSRQFPYRFLTAYKAVQSDWWGEALSDALDHSLSNLPRFSGRTAVLVDTSGSMRGAISEKSEMSHVEIAALMGAAMTRAAGADLYGFASGIFRHEVPLGQSVLKTTEALNRKVGSVGHGTELHYALRYVREQGPYDRVVLVTDFQAFAASPALGYGGSPVARRPMNPGITGIFPDSTRMYGINPLGYTSTGLDLSMPHRYEIGGFSDQVFKMIGQIEAGNANWPF
jgi:hypothetical protein